MLSQLSLRIRIFLFFALLGVGGAGLITAALFAGYRKAMTGEMVSGFVMAGVIGGFGILGLTAAIWLLFDENVAKPIERLAAGLRARAHAGADGGVKADTAKYLGDLAPAAEAMSRQLTDTALHTASAIASETSRLAAERDRLTALLTEIPVATVLVSPRHQIVLYDGQAAAVLAQIHTPRLNASIFDYLEKNAIEAAFAQVSKKGLEVAFAANGTEGEQTYSLRMKPLERGSGYILIIEGAEAHLDPHAERPLIYDFDLLEQNEGTTADTTRLSDLTYVVFDTETTGLLPHKDEIVQIGAVRVVRGKIVPGEQIDTLVNPQMKIPPASTKVHRITDSMVSKAPIIDKVAKDFHRFARDAVIVAHNAPFDMAFMHRHGKRLGLEWTHPVLDTVLVSAVLFGASQTHTLDALCERLGVTIPEALRHTAMGDAFATAEVLCKMLPMLEARGITTFGDMLQQTRKHGRLLEDLN
ncbi:3'-5' exonuclease [Thalassovita sp.]|uniref:3'-5' exonuclease n=1 Tax=Thalassovita sp. TaxID=1979401 RepID=UPI0029DE6950|nr:3'-5' exonuclease [Thalassovita sp.]